MFRLSLHSLSACALLVTAACAPQQEAAPQAAEPTMAAEPEVEVETLTASAVLMPREDGTTTGGIVFEQTGDTVAITVHIENAPPGTHGFHLHEVGDCSAPDFTSAGGHFNPGSAPHGGPMDAERHAGDLGNVEVAEDGTAHVEITSDMLTVAAGPNSVVGRGVILHEDADDLVSQPTGAAGGRLACGVIAFGAPEAAAAGAPGDSEG